jgi:IS5 family transposase
MRIVKSPQLQIGQVDITGIKLDLKSRDDIPHILLGLQHIYSNEPLREEVFKILEQVKPTRSGKELTEEQRDQTVDSNKGRPGMEQWTILVLGALRLGLNTDYDRIHELANQHQTIRQMLGHSDWCDETTYHLQTIKDNLRLFTPEILDQINQVVVKAGHALVKKSPNGGPIATNEKKLYARCDSFVLETNVHFPTDLNLLYDAVRKAIEESHGLAEAYGLSGWRQYRYNIRVFKRQYRIVQKLKHSTSTDEKKREAREVELEGEYFTYLLLALDYFEKSEQTLQQALEKGALSLETTQLIEYQNYIQILQDQIYRRTILEEKIPHDEKIFSIFEPHTEWISKGKAGVPVELGLRVCIVEDQYRFILHHQVMQKQTDDKIAVFIAQETLKRFPTLSGMSFDKGFHSVKNQKELASLLEQVTLPKKGRLNEAEQARESSPEFKQHRWQHSAVESAINALEHNGLDVCPDHGIEGLKRYVSLAIVSRNIKRLGAVIRQQELEKEKRLRGSYKKAA